MATQFSSMETNPTKTFKVSANQIKEERQPEALANYTVVLINMTDLQIALACYNFKPGGNNEWFRIRPPVGRTCSSDYDTCHAQQRWGAVWNCNCADSSFELTLVTEPDSDGNATGATWRIDPNCSAAGGSIGLR